MKNLKWFWIINYALTIASIIFTFIVINSSGLYKFPVLKMIYYIITVNEKITPLLFILEWLQIPLVLGFLIWKKQERTKWHWLYFILLIFLTLAKIILYFAAALGFARGEA